MGLAFEFELELGLGLGLPSELELRLVQNFQFEFELELGQWLGVRSSSSWGKGPSASTSPSSHSGSGLGSDSGSGCCSGSSEFPSVRLSGKIQQTQSTGPSGACDAHNVHDEGVNVVFLVLPTNNREFKHRGSTAYFERFCEMWDPYSPSRTRFSNALAYNSSNV